MEHVHIYTVYILLIILCMLKQDTEYGIFSEIFKGKRENVSWTYPSGSKKVPSTGSTCCDDPAPSPSGSAVLLRSELSPCTPLLLPFSSTLSGLFCVLSVRTLFAFRALIYGNLWARYIFVLISLIHTLHTFCFLSRFFSRPRCYREKN